jgi:hypothetical protein
MAEEMQMYAVSSDDDDLTQNIDLGDLIIDWRIELIEGGWVVHIAGMGDRKEAFPATINQRPMLVQFFCFSMWPVTQANAFNIYSGGYNDYWNLDPGGVGTGASCMSRFNALNTANNMNAIRLKTAYARFAYETR